MPYPRFRIELAAGGPFLEEALLLLQAGVLLEARTGLSARAFMVEELGFEPAYVEGAISTVFLDDKPVDDIDAAIVPAGARLSLSAAMPGLVGAVMRRKSPYASFREGISHDPGEEGPTGRRPGAGAPRGLVKLKLFNAVMRERGAEILARGVLVPRGIAEGLQARPSGDPGGGEELVFLSVTAGEGRTP